MVGPSHHEAFDGVAVVTREPSRLLSGQVPIDEPLAAALLDPRLRIVEEPRPHQEEHCLEMRCPSSSTWCPT
jgi:AmmeMemoRadiSam system protein B